MIQHEMTMQEKAHHLYDVDGLRTEVIAERLGIKQSSVRTFISNQRRVMGIPPKNTGFNINPNNAKKI